MASIPNLKITKRGGAVGRFGDNLPVEKNTMKLKLCPLIWSKVFSDILYGQFLDGPNGCSRL